MAVPQLVVGSAKTLYGPSVLVRLQCASLQVTRVGSTKVSLGLADEFFWIFAAKSTVGNYDHVLLCNGIHLRAINNYC